MSNLPRSQKSADALVAEARACAARGDLAGAESRCKRVLDGGIEDPTAAALLGAIHAHRGDLASAAALLQRAAAAAPDAPDMHAELGRTLLRADRLDEGIAALRRAARIKPDAAVLSDLGHGLNKRGDNDEAEIVLRQAIALDPNFAFAHANLGAVLRAKKQFGEVADAYTNAARIKPDFYEAHFHAGLAFVEDHQMDRAQVAWEKAFALRPTGETQFAIASALFELKRVWDAVPYFRRAIELSPHESVYYSALASTLLETDEKREAERMARRAVELNPESASAHHVLAIALRALNRLEEALAECEIAARIDPGSSIALSLCGNLLSQLGRDDEAIARSRLAMEQFPGNWDAHNAMVTSLLWSGRLNDALELARRALIAHPNLGAAHAHLGTLLYEAGDIPAALAEIRIALASEPVLDDWMSTYGLINLSLGNFAEGWDAYEHRPKPTLVPRLKAWDGAPLHGKAIVLQSEQGMGDVINFVRYAPLVSQQRGGKVILACPAPLQRLMQTVAGVECVITSLDDPRGAKVKLSSFMLDLPRLFGTKLETIPSNVPYLSVPAPSDIARRNALEAAIDSAAGSKRVGLVWAGNAGYGQDRKRSIKIDLLEPLTKANPAVRFFSLQVNPVAKRDRAVTDRLGITDLSALLGDFADTAAALAKLDLLISVDTSVAHLAGALARPVWILLPMTCDFRWLRDRSDSPWYPTMRLFRQSKYGDWPAVIARVAEQLRD